ncbi:MAG: FkbM family methyltransferase [Rhodospirillaceae bacterium]
MHRNSGAPSLRISLARTLGHLPYFPLQHRMLCLLHDPDKVRAGQQPNVQGVFPLGPAQLQCDTASFIEWGVVLKGGLERGLLQWFLDIGSRVPFDRFIDVGANVGTFAVPLSHIMPVMAFEPLGRHVKRLEQNAALNRPERIAIHGYALSDRESTETLYLKQDHCNEGIGALEPFADGSAMERWQIETKRFDDVFDLAEETLLIKIDVEGHERQALKGMAKTLRANKCLLYIETTQDAVGQELEKIGYEILPLRPNIFCRPQRGQVLDGHLLAYNFPVKTGL